jgi:hypothetical protein
MQPLGCLSRASQCQLRFCLSRPEGKIRRVREAEYSNFKCSALGCSSSHAAASIRHCVSNLTDSSGIGTKRAGLAHPQPRARPRRLGLPASPWCRGPCAREPVGESQVSSVGRIKSRARSAASAVGRRWSPWAHSGLLNPSPDFLSLSARQRIYGAVIMRQDRCGVGHLLTRDHKPGALLMRRRILCGGHTRRAGLLRIEPDPKTPGAASVDCDAAARSRGRLVWRTGPAGARFSYLSRAHDNAGKLLSVSTSHEPECAPDAVATGYG